MALPGACRSNRVAPARQSLLASAVVVALFSRAAPAAAQTAPPADDRAALLEQAQDARLVGNHARALEFAVRAGAIQMTPSLQLFVAEEYDALGRAAEALENAQLCSEAAEHDTQLRNRDAILERCRALVSTLRSPPAGAPASRVESPAPIARPGAVSAVDPHANAPATAGPPREMPNAPRRGVPAGAAFTAVGGAAALGASAVFFVLRGQAIGNCVPSGGDLVCPTQQDADRAQMATTWTVLADVSLAAGVALAAGGVLWMLAGHHGAEGPRVSATAAPVPGGMVLGVGGSL